MKNIARIYLPFSLLLLMLSGCANMKQLKLSRERIDYLMQDQLTPREKFDGLGEELVILLDVALSRPTVVGTYKHVNKFTNQNGKDLEKLYDEIYEWQQNMSPPQKVGFTTRVATKSYTRRFITLLPKFKKKVGNKYQQLVLFSRIMNLFNPLKKKDGGKDKADSKKG